MITGKLLKFIRSIYDISPFRKYFFYRYFYQFSPPQLNFFCECISKTHDLEGIILEIGCAEGRTTVFLNKYMEFMKIKKNYTCIDTFSGFTVDDIAFEKNKRNKDESVLKVQFVANKKEWVDKTLRMNNIYDVKTIEADVNKFNFDQNDIKKIAFCLLDVDLYQPVKSALNNIWDRITPGGMIVVDDCRQDKYYDGALQAYQEFVKEKGIPENIILEKLGIIQK